VFAALNAWLDDPRPEQADEIGRIVVEVAASLGLEVRHLQLGSPDLPPVRVTAGEGGVEHAVASGSIRISGDELEATTFVRALDLLLSLARGRARANQAAAQLLALEEAVREISGILDHARVLQLIVDRVRELASAEYAALGIVDRDGVIEQFITSGIDPEQRARIGALPRGLGLLGLIIREARSYRIADIGSHPDSYGFPPNHPPMQSFLGVPVTARGAAVGRLYLTNKVGAGEFTEEDQGLVELFALHAGIAIENARLHSQVQRLAIVDERDRISRDLHDSVIQSIYAQTLALDDVPDLIGEAPDEARQRVDEAIDALHAVIRDLRNFIFGLRPVLLESGTLAEGLGHLASELRRNGGVEVTVESGDADAEAEALPIEVVAEMLAITREALSNIARHAGASVAVVSLESGADEVRLTIRDDGRGFDATVDAAHGHHGLANMRARSETLGGRFSIDSSGAGTRIIITLPRSAAAHRRGDE
jgi:signal transduction histidine kinase